MSESNKLTACNNVPKNWKKGKLRDYIEIVSGCSPSSLDLNISGRYNFYKVSQLNDFEKYMLDSPYKFNKGSLVPKGCIIFPKRGASIFTNKIRILAQPSFFDTNIMSIKCKEGLGNEFLYYFLLDFRLSSIADTSSIPQINNKHINPLKIVLPPIEEQQKIAEILSTVDEKIELIDAQINQTQELKKGLMQQLLTKGFGGHTEFKSTELGNIPEKWRIIKLNDICEKITDGSHFSPKPHKQTGFLIATVKDMLTSSFNLTTCANITMDDFEALERNGCKPVKNDVLFSKDGTIGKTFVFDGQQNVVLLSSVAIIRPRAQKCLPTFVCQVLQSDIFYNQLEGLKSGSAIRRIVLSAIKSIKIPLPPLLEQERISSTLSVIDEKLEILKAKQNSYEQLKKGLMQQMLRGKLRVNSYQEASAVA